MRYSESGVGHCHNLLPKGDDADKSESTGDQIEIDKDEDDVDGGVDGHNVGAGEEEEEEEEEGSDTDDCPSSEDASGWDGLEEDLDDDSDLGDIDFNTLF